MKKSKTEILSYNLSNKADYFDEIYFNAAKKLIGQMAIPQARGEKQGWFIVTLLRTMNREELESLCIQILARIDFDHTSLISKVEEIQD